MVGDPAGEDAQQAIRTAYERLLSGSGLEEVGRSASGSGAGLRAMIRESWQRSLAHLPIPDKVSAPILLEGAALAEHRARHPLAAVLPVVQRLLVEPSADTGIVVVLGDEHGRLLWVDGDRSAMSLTEKMLLTPGADWSENAMGTSAPGTALVLDDAVQIVGAEHFVPTVQPWSCTALPIHDPDGFILGVLDVTGGPDAASPRTLAWVRAAVVAIETELRLRRLQGPASTPGHPYPPETEALRRHATTAGRASAATHPDEATRVALSVLGRATGLLTSDVRTLTLSRRHTEILMALMQNPRGLTLEGLAAFVDPRLNAVTLRAEMSRLRRTLEGQWGEVLPSSRPYRLPRPIRLDAVQVYELISRGHLDEAVRRYRGEVLPSSEAPGVMGLRERVSRALREAVLSDGSVTTVLAYLELPEAASDLEAWTCALQLLPASSSRRAVIVAHLEQLERELR